MEETCPKAHGIAFVEQSFICGSRASSSERHAGKVRVAPVAGLSKQRPKGAYSLVKQTVKMGGQHPGAILSVRKMLDDLARRTIHKINFRPGAWNPLKDIAGQVHNINAAAIVTVVVESEEQGRVAGLVRRGEEWVGGEGAPRLADGAEAAEVLGGDAQQDLVQRVRGEIARARGGGAQLRRSHRESAGGG